MGTYLTLVDSVVHIKYFRVLGQCSPVLVTTVNHNIVSQISIEYSDNFDFEMHPGKSINLINTVTQACTNKISCRNEFQHTRSSGPYPLLMSSLKLSLFHNRHAVLVFSKNGFMLELILFFFNQELFVLGI